MAFCLWASHDVVVLRPLAVAHPERTVWVTIASRLVISPKTVRNHIEHIYTKLDVTNRAGAALCAMQHGLVGPPGSA